MNTDEVRISLSMQDGLPLWRLELTVADRTTLVGTGHTLGEAANYLANVLARHQELGVGSEAKEAPDGG